MVLRLVQWPTTASRWLGHNKRPCRAGLLAPATMAPPCISTMRKGYQGPRLGLPRSASLDLPLPRELVLKPIASKTFSKDFSSCRDGCKYHQSHPYPTILGYTDTALHNPGACNPMGCSRSYLKSNPTLKYTLRNTAVKLTLWPLLCKEIKII